MSNQIIESNLEKQKQNSLQMATFAAGCFWGIEETFRQVKGVKSTIVGYTGGWFENPTYKDVCTHRSGHAEAVQMQFDSNEVSYEQLLDVFWSIHDPTTKDRQGPDIGSQYRSMIAYHTLEQELLAEKSKANLEKSSQLGKGTIVTEIVPASTFHKAEDYHQNYYQKRGGGSCYNILSKKLKISTTWSDNKGVKMPDTPDIGHAERKPITTSWFLLPFSDNVFYNVLKEKVPILTIDLVNNCQIKDKTRNFTKNSVIIFSKV